MTVQTQSSSVWSIVLAGGEGERIRPYIQQWLGYSVPKQYCTFVGTRSMLEHTWDRANQIVLPRRKVTVVGRTHQQGLDHHFKRQNEGKLIFQPRNCDTAPGVFLPLTYLRAWDPQSVVVLFPSDHFIFPEDRFVTTVRQAVRAVEFLSDRMILLGVRPTRLEPDYGLMSVGGVLGWSEGTCIRRIQSFVEKPNAADGMRLMSDGALWNTLVLVAKVETLWKAGWLCFPDMMERFERLRRNIGTPAEGSTLQAIYQDMPSRNFSRQILQPLAGQLGVMELEGVTWSDWGRLERIVETLQSLGKKPAFPMEAFTGSGVPSLPCTQMEMGYPS
jgi:mannose-1-phosphate guanylyltransferase